MRCWQLELQMSEDASEKYIGLFVLGLSLIFALINLVAWFVHGQIFLVFVLASFVLLIFGTRIVISGKLPSFLYPTQKDVG